MIRVNDVHIEYPFKDKIIEAVKGVSIDINDGDYVTIVGPSGSGKSSLLSAIAGLVFPRTGDVFIDKYRINRISRSRRAKVRSKYIGVIFQFSEMIGRFTIEENLQLAWRAVHGGAHMGRYQERLEYLCGRLDMYDLLHTHPSRLSGGQLQKTAVARALIKDSPVILADEPSGDLDPSNIIKVKELLKEEHASGKSIILVTHDMQMAKDANTIFELRNGIITNVIKQ